MSEYEKGFEDGKKWMQEEIARNPSALFGLLPEMGNALKAQLSGLEGQLSTAQKAVIEAGASGRITSSEMLEQLKKLRGE